MITSQQGLNLIMDFESLQLEAYLCPGNRWTIGYGHTQGVQEGDRITKQQAEKFLIADLIQFEAGVSKRVKVRLNQQQFDALISFTFNVGLAAFSASTLLKKLNQGDYAGCAAEFERWVFAQGKSVAGLARRRRLERRLFES